MRSRLAALVRHRDTLARDYDHSHPDPRAPEPVGRVRGEALVSLEVGWSQLDAEIAAEVSEISGMGEEA